MTPYYEHAGITIYHGDCREVDVGSAWVGAVITDPPYGIDWKPRVTQAPDWKDVRVDIRPWLVMAPKICVWGGNYYTDQLPPSESWLIWLKRPAGFDNDPRTYATVEMAWTNYGGKPRTRTHVWDGGKRAGAAINRTFCHPAQKPIEIMRWAITQAGEIVGCVLDPYMGSGTTLDAAKALGYPAIGIEREERYCEMAATRLQQDVLPLEVV